MAKKKRYHKLKDEIIVDLGELDLIITVRGLNKGKRVRARAMKKPKHVDFDFKL